MDNGPLNRYWRVLDGSERARYLVSKETRIGAALDSSVEDLLRAHDQAFDGVLGDSRSPSILEAKVELARRSMTSCELCERRCGVDRTSGKPGHCGVLDARISSEFIHLGEEPELIPSYTIFFAGCTFDCVYCQNSDISTNPTAGSAISPSKLARMIEARAGRLRDTHSLSREFGGAANVNWVGGDPTSNMPYILQTMNACRANLPQVWNSNMYLTEPAMGLLRGVIDVYLTDFKYGNDACARRLSNVDDYSRIVRRNHLLARSDAEMIIRHLVLPSHIECCTRPVLNWIADNLEAVKVNVMGQYRPCHRADEYDEISEALRSKEYKYALEIAEDLGLDLTQ